MQKKCFLLALLSIVMLSAGWLGAGGITLLAGLVPLLLISAVHKKGRASFWKVFGWTAMVLGGWTAATTWWTWYAFRPTPFIAIAIMIALFGTVFMFYHYVSKRAKRPLAYMILVSGWIAFEYLYTVGEVSFPWLTLGNGFAGSIKLVQWYDTTGVFGGSLWVLLVNILLFEAILAPKCRRKSAWVSAGLMVILPVTVSLVRYYTYREKGSELKVTVVQPNIDPWEKHYIPPGVLTQALVEEASKAPADVDYIVMPETALQGNILEEQINDYSDIINLRTLLSQRYPGAQIITGAATWRMYHSKEKVSSTARFHSEGEYWYDVYNTALAIDTSGNVGKYHKSMLLVGVERMPWYNVMKNIEWLIVDLGGMTGQHGYDDRPTVFTAPNGTQAGAAICWEGVFGEFYSGFVTQGAQVMFIISNDGWWEDTPGYKQLFLFSRLRAVEARRSIARSANTGISGFINQRGDMSGRLGWNVRDASTQTIRANDKLTFYTRYGDYIARLSCFVFAMGILYFIAYRVRRKDKLVD